MSKKKVADLTPDELIVRREEEAEKKRTQRALDKAAEESGVKDRDALDLATKQRILIQGKWRQNFSILSEAQQTQVKERIGLYNSLTTAMNQINDVLRGIEPIDADFAQYALEEFEDIQEFSKSNPPVRDNPTYLAAQNKSDDIDYATLSSTDQDLNLKAQPKYFRLYGLAIDGLNPVIFDDYIRLMKVNATRLVESAGLP